MNPYPCMRVENQEDGVCPDRSSCRFGCSGRYPWPMDRDEILRVLRAFEVSGLDTSSSARPPWASMGGPRDRGPRLFIRATAENVERLRAALRAAYADDPHIERSPGGPARRLSRRPLLPAERRPLLRHPHPSRRGRQFRDGRSRDQGDRGRPRERGRPPALYRLKKAPYGPRITRMRLPSASGFNLNSSADPQSRTH